MDSKTIKCRNIYEMFKPEFFCTHPQLTGCSTFYEYEFSKFINRKDLGVISIDYINDIYEIVDERKWVLTKLKYGI